MWAPMLIILILMIVLFLLILPFFYHELIDVKSHSCDYLLIVSVLESLSLIAPIGVITTVLI